MSNAVDLHALRSTSNPEPKKAPQPQEPNGDDAYAVLRHAETMLTTARAKKNPIERNNGLGDLVGHVVKYAVMLRARAVAANRPQDQAARDAFVSDELVKTANRLVPHVKLTLRAKVVPYSPGGQARAYREAYPIEDA